MLAADQGNIDAQLLFAAAAEVIYETAPDAVRDWHQKRGVEYLIQARDHGSDIAALNLAHVFSEKDPSEAYTNAMLATLIGNQRIQHQVDADYHSIARAQALLNVARTKMDDEQVAAARSRARDIFARCCGGS